MKEIKTKVWITRDCLGGDYRLWAQKPTYYGPGKSHSDCCDVGDWEYTNENEDFCVDNIWPGHIKEFIPLKKHLSSGSRQIIEAEMIFRIKD